MNRSRNSAPHAQQPKKRAKTSVTREKMLLRAALRLWELKHGNNT